MTYIERLFWALYLGGDWYEQAFLKRKNSDGPNMRRFAVYGRCKAFVSFDRVMCDDKRIQGLA